VKQSSFRYLGALDLLLAGVLLAVFGLDTLGSPQIGLLLSAGVAAVAAGSLAELSVGPVTVPWRWFAAATYVLLGVLPPVGLLPPLVAGPASAPVAEAASFVVACVGAAAMLFFGVDVARGGEHLEVTPDVERVVGR